MNRMSEPELILASASPRRSALLRQIGVAHRIAVPEIAEVREPRENLEACIKRLALAKARQVRERERTSKLPVLGADTAVVLGDEMLGKPADRAAALAMLARLEGRSHRVLTAVALVGKHGETLLLARSTVTFRRIDADEIERYWDSGEPVDKAGGYGIQGIAAVFVEKLEGSYSGVMGLPLFETAALLDAAGVPRWQPAALLPGPA
jgi:septum formation protein